LETKCDPTRLASDGFHALHAVPVFGRANPDACNNLKLLLSFRADVNVQLAAVLLIFHPKPGLDSLFPSYQVTGFEVGLVCYKHRNQYVSRRFT